MCFQIKKISIFAVIFTYMFFMNTPYAFVQNSSINKIFTLGRAILTLVFLIIFLMHKITWNKFDSAIVLVAILLLASGYHAGITQKIAVASTRRYMRGALSKVIMILGYWLVAKLAFESEKKYQYEIIKTIWQFLFSLCATNILTQFLGVDIYAKGNIGNVFFWGLDNTVGVQYLFMFFYACILNSAYKCNDGKKLLLLSIGLTIFEAFYRQMGTLTVVSILMLLVVGRFYSSQSSNLWKTDIKNILLIMLSGYVVLAFIFRNTEILQELVNQYLYEKENTLSIRFVVQEGLIERWMQTPLWGLAYTFQHSEWRNIDWSEYAINNGQAHNYFIEFLCNYGIIAFSLFFFLILLSLKKLSKRDAKISLIGYAFLFVLLYGFFDVGSQNIFCVLPMAYYFIHEYDKSFVKTWDTTVKEKSTICLQIHDY